MRRLPPLNAVKAFESAARHRSMQAAATELCVTPAAVSQQVRSLERYLGLPLFRRLTRGLALTDEGEVYLREARQILDRLAAATEQLVERRVAGVVRVSAIPSLANRWLAPRLGSFLERYPDVTIRLIEDVRVADFNRDPFDVAVRYGAGPYPGLDAVRFMHETLDLVAAPKWAHGGDAVRTSADLARVPLLHEAAGRLGEPWSLWQTWLDALGVNRNASTDCGPRFNSTATLLQAAESALGVAIGRRRLITDEVKSGRLVRLLGLYRTSRLAYWTLSPPDAAVLPRVAAFRAWLDDQGQAAEADHATMSAAASSEIDDSGGGIHRAAVRD